MTLALSRQRVQRAASFNAAMEIALPIQSAVQPDECRAIYDAAAALPAGSTVVEVGAWRGRTAVLLSHAVEPGSRVVTIDPFDNTVGIGGTRFRPEVANDLRANLRDHAVTGVVTFLHQTSAEAASEWSGPVGMLWVDGDHTIAGVMADWQGWSPFLHDKSIVALHDSHFEGPKALIEKLTSEGWRVCNRARTLSVLVRS